MNKPTFSIIMPVYKVREVYLRQSIASVLEQTYPEFELILVDDGSPDHCGEICEEYAQNDSRVRVIHQKNQGVSAARNTGVQAATADWLWFVDSDDWIEKDSLEILHTYISKGLDVDILQFGAYLDVEEESRPIDCGLETDRLYDLSIPEERLFLYRRIFGVSTAKKRISPAYYSWDKLIRRETLLKNQLAYPVGIPKSEDKVFFCLCYEKINNLRTVPDFLYHYRLNEESICHSYTPNLDQARLKLSKALLPIAKRMDEELADVLGQPGFHEIYDDYMQFIFKIITDVLMLHFYHKENPNRRTWRRDALRFLRTEPFQSSIKYVPYSSLSKFIKIKKFLLEHGCVATFCCMHTLLGKIRGKQS